MTAQTNSTIDISELKSAIDDWLKARLEDDALDWISEKSEKLWSGGEDWEFFTSFSAVPRYTGKKALDLSDKEQQKAEDIRAGWKPGEWSVDELGRTLIVLSISNRNKKEFLDLLEKTHQSSDIGEAEALYKALAVLPYPEDLRARAAEGIRSNMTSVFNAVAHNNPYPAEYFDEGAWNQMVLKALFVGSPLYLIEGIDDRTNRKLAEMLIDYAHERWAADRDVSPELWRPVGPFAEGEFLEDLNHALDQGGSLQKQAAILALSASPSEKAAEISSRYQDIQKEIDENNVTWDRIGRSYHK